MSKDVFAGRDGDDGKTMNRYGKNNKEQRNKSEVEKTDEEKLRSVQGTEIKYRSDHKRNLSRRVFKR